VHGRPFGAVDKIDLLVCTSLYTVYIGVEIRLYKRSICSQVVIKISQALDVLQTN
jgi:hypothetical protein